jgi:hypothetical protein
MAEHLSIERRAETRAAIIDKTSAVPDGGRGFQGSEVESSRVRKFEGSWVSEYERFEMRKFGKAGHVGL